LVAKLRLAGGAACGGSPCSPSLRPELVLFVTHAPEGRSALWWPSCAWRVAALAPGRVAPRSFGPNSSRRVTSYMQRATGTGGELWSSISVRHFAGGRDVSVRIADVVVAC